MLIYFCAKLKLFKLEPEGNPRGTRVDPRGTRGIPKGNPRGPEGNPPRHPGAQFSCFSYDFSSFKVFYVFQYFLKYFYSFCWFLMIFNIFIYISIFALVFISFYNVQSKIIIFMKNRYDAAVSNVYHGFYWFSHTFYIKQ